jgi:Xaa-Pro dipeptidase
MPFAMRCERARMAVGGGPFLTRDLPTIRYLTGFSGSNGALLLSDESATLITDGRYRDQAESETTDVAVVIERDAVAAILALNLQSISVDPQLTVDQVDRLRQANVVVHMADHALRDLRAVKDEWEIEVLARACDITARGLEVVVQSASAGDSEVQLARRLEWIFAELGADDRAFPTIVASGPNSAIPHHEPTARCLQQGDLLVIDCGAKVAGYHADMTRTFVVGTPPHAWQREIHDVVRLAQQAAIDAAVPGVGACVVDDAARSVISEAGYGDEFTHGTGHGVGLQIHEPPMVVATSADSISAGSPITVEPGIYLPGRGGVRIEDTVVVGGAARVLTSASRDLIVVG